MLFDKFSARSLQLANHMVMAPMTRSRATPEHTPDALMATYYGQRATAGLIITEGTSPSPNGLGYPRIPGLYDAAQVSAWRATTAAVHANGGNEGGKIFVQFMHCGRVAHVANLPTGAEVLGPGTAVCPGEMYTDTLGMQPYSPPRAMVETDIAHAVNEHVTAAKLALDAGLVAAITSASCSVRPLLMRCPVMRACIIAPTEKRSARPSTSFAALSCAGDM